MNIAIDIGYHSTKAVGPNGLVRFASIVGTPDESRFTLNGDTTIVMTSPHRRLVGEDVENQSLYQTRWQTRDWINTPEYLTLFHAALSGLTTATQVNVNLITGLPVRYYTADRDLLKTTLQQTHRFTRLNHHAQTINISNVKIIPQNIGTYLQVALDDSGRPVDDHDLINQPVGIIDIGSHTTNLSVIQKFTELPQDSTSIEAGAWKLARQVSHALDQKYPDLNLTGHKLLTAIRIKTILYYGEKIDISPIIDAATTDLAQEILTIAKERWSRAAHLYRILITGGGSLLLSDQIKNHYRHAHQVNNPVFANVVGYYKLANRPEIWS